MSGRYIRQTEQPSSDTRVAICVTMRSNYLSRYQASFTALLLHCKPGVNWHGLGGGPGAAGLAHVRRAGVVGTAGLQLKHVYPGTQGVQSVGQVCMACLFVVEPVCLPWAISHLAATSAIPATYFSGRDLGTFWPGIGRDEPPCRIQSVIWYLVLHTHPHAAQGTAWYIVYGSPVSFSHTRSLVQGAAGNLVDRVLPHPARFPEVGTVSYPEAYFKIRAPWSSHSIINPQQRK